MSYHATPAAVAVTVPIAGPNHRQSIPPVVGITRDAMSGRKLPAFYVAMLREPWRQADVGSTARYGIRLCGADPTT